MSSVGNLLSSVEDLMSSIKDPISSIEDYRFSHDLFFIIIGLYMYPWFKVYTPVVYVLYFRKTKYSKGQKKKLPTCKLFEKQFKDNEKHVYFMS